MSVFCRSTQLSKHKEVEQQVTPEKINCHLNTWVMFTSFCHVFSINSKCVVDGTLVFQFLSIVYKFSNKKLTFIIPLHNSFLK